MTEERKRAEALQQGNAFALHNHMELEYADAETVVIRMEIREESKNPLGIVHGGAMYTMADSAAGFAANLGEGRFVTQTGALHYLANCREGVLRAAAHVTHRGRKSCLIKVDITDGSGRLMASGDFSFFRTEG